MKTTNWICWLLAAYICLSEAKNKIRRPLSPLYAPTLILKKPRPINQRISMGNTIHIGSGLSHQRIPYNHGNYRIRRPVYNVLSTSWKNQIPMRAISLNNRPILPQRAPIKEFYSINKIPEYSPEYRPELVALPPTHRGDIDDDKGPIHTIPAPNLSPADKPSIRYDMASTVDAATNLEDVVDHRLYSSDLNYDVPAQNPRTIFGLAAISSGPSSQGTTTNSIPSQRNRYEVTESDDVTPKEHAAVQPAIPRSQELINDITRLYSIIINNPQPRSNELLANHPINSDTSVIGSNAQFGQSNMPMQTNLRSSLNVGFPSTVIPQAPYTTVARQDLPADLHVGHPAPAGPPLSASQLYDLLNNFPHELAERYTTDQRHILQQQQLGQTFESDAAMSFSQPQMHTFNYDEQTNQLQHRRQQQILPDQDYASESVTADYNLDPEDIHEENDNAHSDEELTHPISGAEQSENNNIEYGEMTHRGNPTMYFDKVADDDAISSRFYTTLPNRETAEKLAALAAAGNVNSRLIGQLRKQQRKDTRRDEAMPFNHKNDDSEITIQRSAIIRDQPQTHDQSKSDRNMKVSQQKQKQQQQQQHRRRQSVQNDEESPLRITVPDESGYVTNDDVRGNVDRRKDDIGDIEYEYEYENEGGEIEDVQSTISLDEKPTSYDNNSRIEFGSHLRS